MKDNDHLVINSMLFAGMGIEGGVLVIVGIFFFIIDWGPSLILILVGLLLLLLRRICILDRHTLRLFTYIGLGLPQLAFRIPLVLEIHSLKNIKKVLIRHEQEEIPLEGGQPPYVKNIYRLHFGLGIWLASFKRRDKAEKLAAEIEKFLFMED